MNLSKHFFSGLFEEMGRKHGLLATCEMREKGLAGRGSVPCRENQKGESSFKESGRFKGPKFGRGTHRALRESSGVSRVSSVLEEEAKREEEQAQADASEGSRESSEQAYALGVAKKGVASTVLARSENKMAVCPVAAGLASSLFARESLFSQALRSSFISPDRFRTGALDLSVQGREKGSSGIMRPANFGQNREVANPSGAQERFLKLDEEKEIEESLQQKMGQTKILYTPNFLPKDGQLVSLGAADLPKENSQDESFKIGGGIWKGASLEEALKAPLTAFDTGVQNSTITRSAGNSVFKDGFSEDLSVGAKLAMDLNSSQARAQLAHLDGAAVSNPIGSSDVGVGAQVLTKARLEKMGSVQSIYQPVEEGAQKTDFAEKSYGAFSTWAQNKPSFSGDLVSPNGIRKQEIGMEFGVSSLIGRGSPEALSAGKGAFSPVHQEIRREHIDPKPDAAILSKRWNISPPSYSTRIHSIDFATISGRAVLGSLKGLHAGSGPLQKPGLLENGSSISWSKGLWGGFSNPDVLGAMGGKLVAAVAKLFDRLEERLHSLQKQRIGEKTIVGDQVGKPSAVQKDPKLAEPEYTVKIYSPIQIIDNYNPSGPQL